MTGFIILNKEQNMTSFSACSRVRRLTGAKKAGHTGTLDPMATGVLTVALSGATRFIDLLPSHDKSYKARAKLGVTTDTLDITGKILSESPVSVTDGELRKTVLNFTGEIEQIPPMYSAVSVDGKRLYELAREGKEVERKSRRVNVYSAEISDFDGREFGIEVTCSSGTYIRTLIDDIGRALGCGAVMTQLERTSANGFSVSEAHTLTDIEKAVGEGRINDLIIPVERCFESLGRIAVSPAQSVRFKNGGELALDRLKGSFNDAVYTVFSPEGEFLGLGEVKTDENILTVKKVYIDG